MASCNMEWIASNNKICKFVSLISFFFCSPYGNFKHFFNLQYDICLLNLLYFRLLFKNYLRELEYCAYDFIRMKSIWLSCALLLKLIIVWSNQPYALFYIRPTCNGSVKIWFHFEWHWSKLNKIFDSSFAVCKSLKSIQKLT